MVPKRMTKLDLEIQRLQLLLQKQQRTASSLRRGSDYVPAKKKSKPVGYKMQNTFENNLRSVPGGRGLGGVIKMIAAPGTGTQVRKDAIGVLRSARNANTTSGSYIRTEVVDETGQRVSDAQGRKAFGR